MAAQKKVLGQKYPDAGVLTDVYTVPDSKMAVVSTFTVCNQGNKATTFRVSVAVEGAADDEKQYLYRDQLVRANRTFAATIGATLGETDAIRFSSKSGTCSINVFGSEADA